MRKFGIVILSIVLFTSVASAQKRTLDKIAAVVGSSIILQSDIELQYSLYMQNGYAPNPGYKCQLLQGLISQKLLNQQAVIDSVDVKEDEVDNEIDRRMRRMTQQAGGEDKLEQFLGRPLIQYKDEIRQDIKESMIAERMRGKITEKLNTTPQDVKKFFNTIPKDSLPTFNKEVEVGEIVFIPKLSKEEKEPYRQKAQELLDRIKKGGEDFGTLATAYSQDVVSAQVGGDVGFADRSTFVKEFTAWAFKLKTGEISPVFETDFGFHFLQVIERRGESVHVRHILIIPGMTDASLTRAKGRADTVYTTINTNKKIPDYFSNAASTFSEDKESKFNGGMLLNPDNVDVRTTLIPTDKLDPQIAVVVDTMKVGQVSKPQLFKDNAGKTSYRIFYLKSVTDAHKANLDQDYPKIKAMAAADKTNRTVSQWFEKKRKENYIKIDAAYQSCPQLQGWSTTTTISPQANL